MAIEMRAPRSRRALLAGIGGAGAALAAQALGRPLPALADGGVVKVGGVYRGARTATTLHNRVNNRDVFKVISDHGGKAITGISNGDAVTGRSGDGHGVHGISAEGFGVLGSSQMGDGVLGASVHSAGVRGHSETMFGVVGVGAEGGVGGLSESGIGVSGASDNYVGVKASSGARGIALLTQGRVQHEGVSGNALIEAQTTLVVVTPETSVSAASIILLTPRENLGGRGLWYNLHPAAGTFTIHIGAALPKETTVSWLLLG